MLCLSCRLEGPGKTNRSIPIQSNLPPMDDEEGAGLHQEGWVSRLAACRWFRRGWTLQELIAPKQLVFFGIDWNFIGSKLDLLYTLSDITGIDSIALSHRCKLEELSMAKRLSWAAHRRVCSKVILCNGATVAHSFELTHRGLKLKLPILKQGRKGADEISLVVLSCRMEDDFERVLCLHLKEQMADPTNSGETTVCSIEKCTPNCAKS